MVPPKPLVEWEKPLPNESRDSAKDSAAFATQHKHTHNRSCPGILQKNYYNFDDANYTCSHVTAGVLAEVGPLRWG
jgi:hypothetical protein